ncbi:MAG: sulfurtransferase TusA family protein [Fibrobacteraceae bacterium]
MQKNKVYKIFETPLQKWLSVNKGNPALPDALRTLVGHAWVGILRRADPENPVFSPEEALSLAMTLPARLLPPHFGEWISDPVPESREIVAFCENSENFDVSCIAGLCRPSGADLDLRGVRCPLNAVRSRIFLAGLRPGAEVSVSLDDGAPIENVPQALIADGHCVLKTEKTGDYWRIRVRRGDNKVD